MIVTVSVIITAIVIILANSVAQNMSKTRQLTAAIRQAGWSLRTAINKKPMCLIFTGTTNVWPKKATMLRKLITNNNF